MSCHMHDSNFAFLITWQESILKKKRFLEKKFVSSSNILTVGLGYEWVMYIYFLCIYDTWEYWYTCFYRYTCLYWYSSVNWYSAWKWITCVCWYKCVYMINLFLLTYLTLSCHMQDSYFAIFITWQEMNLKVSLRKSLLGAQIYGQLD